MAQFKVLSKSIAQKIDTLGNTPQVRDLIGALSAINSEDDSKLKSAGWARVKEAFEDFGFTVCYDRNLALVTVALFAAILRSKCQSLIDDSKRILNNYKVNDLSLGDAFCKGDGKAIKEILSKNNTFKNMLTDVNKINIDTKYVTKYLNRVGKITPWKLENSKAVLETVKAAFSYMTNNEVRSAKPIDDEIIEISPVINSKSDFKKIKNSKNRIRKVTITGHVKEIPERALKDLPYLEEVTIEEGVEKIQFAAFANCDKLQKVNIPSSVWGIGYGAFGGCEFLEEVNFSDKGLEVISDYAFEGCQNLSKFEIPATVREIGYGAFSECKDLSEIEIPGSVRELGEFAFSNCISLENVYISEGVKAIGASAFAGCTSLKEIKIPAGVENYGRNIFFGCNALETIEFLGHIESFPDLYIGISARSPYAPNSQGRHLGKVIVPDSVDIKELLQKVPEDERLSIFGDGVEICNPNGNAFIVGK